MAYAVDASLGRHGASDESRRWRMSSTGRYDPYAIAAAVARPHAHRSLTQVEGKKADLARDPAAFTAVAIESDDDDDAPQEKGFTKITIADEDSSDEEVVDTGKCVIPSLGQRYILWLPVSSLTFLL